MKPNFKNIDIYAGFQPQNGMEWQKKKMASPPTGKRRNTSM